MPSIIETREEAVIFARKSSREIVNRLRESNARYAGQTGKPSAVSEAEYFAAEDELVAVMLRVFDALPSASATGDSGADPNPEPGGVGTKQ